MKLFVKEPKFVLLLGFLRESKLTLKFSMPRCCLGLTKLLLKSSLAAIEGCWDMVGKDPEDVSELSSLAEPLALVDVLLVSEKKDVKKE